MSRLSSNWTIEIDHKNKSIDFRKTSGRGVLDYIEFTCCFNDKCDFKLTFGDNQVPYLSSGFEIFTDGLGSFVYSFSFFVDNASSQKLFTLNNKSRFFAAIACLTDFDSTSNEIKDILFFIVSEREKTSINASEQTGMSRKFWDAIVKHIEDKIAQLQPQPAPSTTQLSYNL